MLFTILIVTIIVFLLLKIIEKIMLNYLYKLNSDIDKLFKDLFKKGK